MGAVYYVGALMRGGGGWRSALEQDVRISAGDFNIKHGIKATPVAKNHLVVAVANT